MVSWQQIIRMTRTRIFKRWLIKTAFWRVTPKHQLTLVIKMFKLYWVTCQGLRDHISVLCYNDRSSWLVRNLGVILKNWFTISRNKTSALLLFQKSPILSSRSHSENWGKAQADPFMFLHEVTFEQLNKHQVFMCHDFLTRRLLFNLWIYCTHVWKRSSVTRFDILRQKLGLSTWLFSAKLY